MQSHIGCICLAFLHCVFSNGSSNGLPGRMHTHTGCICSTFLHCVLSNFSSNCLHEKRQIHIGCLRLTFLHCVLWNVSSNHPPVEMQSHIGCICEPSFPGNLCHYQCPWLHSIWCVFFCCFCLTDSKRETNLSLRHLQYLTRYCEQLDTYEHDNQASFQYSQLTPDVK